MGYTDESDIMLSICKHILEVSIYCFEKGYVLHPIRDIISLLITKCFYIVSHQHVIIIIITINFLNYWNI